MREKIYVKSQKILNFYDFYELKKFLKNYVEKEEDWGWRGWGRNYTVDLKEFKTLLKFKLKEKLYGKTQRI